MKLPEGASSVVRKCFEGQTWIIEQQGIRDPVNQLRPGDQNKHANRHTNVHAYLQTYTLSFTDIYLDLELVYFRAVSYTHLTLPTIYSV